MRCFSDNRTMAVPIIWRWRPRITGWRMSFVYIVCVILFTNTGEWLWNMTNIIRLYARTVPMKTHFSIKYVIEITYAVSDTYVEMFLLSCECLYFHKSLHWIILLKTNRLIVVSKVVARWFRAKLKNWLSKWWIQCNSIWKLEVDAVLPAHFKISIFNHKTIDTSTKLWYVCIKSVLSMQACF